MCLKTLSICLFLLADMLATCKNTGYTRLYTGYVKTGNKHAKTCELMLKHCIYELNALERHYKGYTTWQQHVKTGYKRASNMLKHFNLC